MKIYIFLISNFFILFIGFGQSLTEFEKILGSDVEFGDWYTSSMTANGNRAILGSWGDDINGFPDVGSAYIYEKINGKWIEQIKLLASDGEESDYFGYSVGISGDIAVVGAYLDDDLGLNAGAVYIFNYNGSSWVQTDKIYAADGSSGDVFGRSIDIEGKRIVIGADGDFYNGTSAGSAYIFENQGGNWVETAHLSPSDGVNYDRFSNCVSISGDRVLIGAKDHDFLGAESGAAYVFKYNGTIWTQEAKLLASDGITDDSFSCSVAIDGTQILIGACQDQSLSGSGAAYLFNFDGNSWIQTQKIIAPDAIAGLIFGRKVDIINDNLLVGADGDNTMALHSGSAYFFKKNGSNWYYNSKMTPSDGAVFGDFGLNLALTENEALIGATGDNGPVSGIASFYTFKIKGTVGQVFNDLNSNCAKATLEPGKKDRMVIIQPGGYIAQSNEKGYWHIDSLPIGQYSVTVDDSGPWNATCSSPLSFNVINPSSLTIAPNVGLISTNPRSEPDISIAMPFMRRCFSDQKIFVRAGNAYVASGVLQDAYVIITLDSLITFQTASIPYIPLGDNTYHFDIGTILPGQDTLFWITSYISCDAVLNETLCLEANLFPIDNGVLDNIPNVPLAGGNLIETIPAPCTFPWDNSSLSVTGKCSNDTIYFSITNQGVPGAGDMICYSPVLIYVDGEVIHVDSVKLNGGESQLFTFMGTGQTWWLYASQHPEHPGNSYPNAHVERCGDLANWTPNLINTLPLDDADPVDDIFCDIVTGGYDPNDKKGFPFGLKSEHFILPNNQIQFMIRFQNTGTDTAFNIVIRDTLDIDFDIFSVCSGASSHDYSFKMFGPRILEWSFSNIMLPDSTTNELESHGFVTFTVDQMPNLADGTLLNNDADIYFDFNDPVITNETWHTVNRHIFSPLGFEEIEFGNQQFSIYPNPVTDEITVSMVGISSEVLYYLYDLTGQIYNTGLLSSEMNKIDVSRLNPGLYILQIDGNIIKIQIL
ncbi:MAG: hypothetical protein RLZ33_2952 [Bacteroidota bacterium]|jgi:uncharacterized repeat protein (TIGR01451 family)